MEEHTKDVSMDESRKGVNNVGINLRSVNMDADKQIARTVVVEDDVSTNG